MPASAIHDALCIKFLSVVSAYQRQHGFPPSNREVGIALGKHSTGHVQYIRDHCARLGWITFREKCPRSLVLTVAGRAVLAKAEAHHVR